MKKLPSLRLTGRRGVIVASLAGAGLLAGALALRVHAAPPAPPPAPNAAAASQASLPAPADPAGAAAAAAEEAKEVVPTTPNVRLVFKVVPPNITTVTWGNKKLGIIKPKAPLIIERPRDSGPMDVVFKTQGYVTVHTRIYTFTNSTLAVKLTPVDKKNTLYGYREELPPDDAAAGAGGAPGMMAPPPPSPANP